MEDDLGIVRPSHGCLDSWARQGVLLLNTTLTVEAHKANSHSNIGWDTFTKNVIEKIGKSKKNIVFLLWGSYAQKKEQLIDGSEHLILKSSHPSPLSAHRGFFGCRHFSQTNNYLRSIGFPVVNWQVE